MKTNREELFMRMINKTLLKPLSFTLLFTLILAMAAPMTASAATSYNSYTTEDGLIIEETLTVSQEKGNVGISTLSTGRTKTATKTHKIKNSSGTVLATYVLKGTFIYGTGNPAKCESASYSTTVNNTHCSFIATAAYSSGNQAIGTYTLRYSSLTTTKDFIEDLKITCSVNGDIS